MNFEPSSPSADDPPPPDGPGRNRAGRSPGGADALAADPTVAKADAAALLFALVFPTAVTWAYFIALRSAPSSLQQGVYMVGKTAQFAFPLLWLWGVRRQRPRPCLPTGRGLGEGLVFGLLVLATMLLGYHFWFKPIGLFDGPGETIRQKVVGFGVGSPAGYLALGVFYSLCHSFLEEYYWRWFVFGQLRKWLSLWTAVLISAAGFMAHHVLVLGLYFGWFSLPTILFSLAVAAGGVAWALIYQRSGSLYGPWLSHLLVDAGIFLIGYDLVRGSLGGP